MAGKVKGLLVEIGGDTSGLQKAISDVNTKTTSLASELRILNKQLKLDPKNTELLAQKQEVLNKSYEETVNKLKILEDVKKQADEAAKAGTEISVQNYSALIREIEKTKKALVSLTEKNVKFNEVSQNLENVSKTFDKVAQKADKLGNKLTTTITAPAVAIGTVAVKGAIDFEDAFVGVEKTVNGTQKQLENLKQGIINLSKEIPSSTTEIAAVAEVAGQLGIATDDILDFTKVMIDLGNSTNLSAEEAASALAKFANITNMSASDYSRLGSVIVDLGNNFSTTEADIVAMSTRLASTGELTGLSEAQILALATAMSSVGIEAEAGGSAMSKLLKQIQVATETGSDDLKEFASVAGMSSEQFKKAFQEDAVQALSAFLGGLQDTERNGKSAIAILDDMDIKEVRLSNTILALSNSSENLNKAVSTANNAWNENVALTTEAEKRYGTTQSQIKIAGNNIKIITNTLGKKLLPVVNKVLDKIKNLTNNFENLNEEQIENILKTGILVASIGPAVKIFSKFSSGVSKATSLSSKFFKALSQGQSKGQALISTFGKANIAIAAVTAAVTAGYIAFKAYNKYLEKNRSEVSKNTEKLKQATDAQIKSREEIVKSQTETMNANLTEIEHTAVLAEELKRITEENGRVKEGYEDRAKFILGELNNALGTEYTMNGILISQYDQLLAQIDKLILKKKAQVILDAQEEKYKEAINNRAKALETLNEAQENYNKAHEKMAKVEYGSREYTKLVNEENQAWQELNKAKQYTNQLNHDIYEYETNATRLASDDIREWQNVVDSINVTFLENGKVVEDTFKKELRAQKTGLEQIKLMYEQNYKTADETQKKILDSQLQTAEQQIQTTLDTLKNQTSLIENDESVVNAWKYVYENQSAIFDEYISTLPEDLRTVIENMVGIYSMSPESNKLIDAAGKLGEDTANSTNKADEFLNSGKDNIQSYYNGINDPTIKNMLLNSTGNTGEEAANKLNSSESATNSGKNLLNGFINGISNPTLKSMAFNILTKFGKDSISKLNNSLGVHSPSVYAEDSAVNVGLGFIKGIKKIQPKVNSTISNMADLSNISSSFGNISNQITDSQRTILTTPHITFNVQRMDEANLKTCLNYVNKKLGGKYIYG